MRKTNRELLESWDMLDLSTEIERHHYTPLDPDTEIIEAVTDFMLLKETDDAYNFICTGSNTGMSWKAVVEWFTNFHAWPKRGFHKGFYNVARRMYNKVKDRWWDANKAFKIHCHSRGIYGLILAYLFWEGEYCENPEVISFGAPEPCKRRGIEKLEKSGVIHHRVVTPHDFIQAVGASRHWETEFYSLPVVFDALDHVNYRKAIAKAIEIENDLKGID